MNRWLSVILSLCFVTSIAFLYKDPVRAEAESGPTKAMWVWDFYASASTPEQRTQLIRFSLENNINLLFVGTKRTLRDHSEEYSDLIQSAHRNGIRIFALAGEASWALEKNHRFALEQIEDVTDYNLAHPSEPFDGIQLDIEPHTLPNFRDNAGSIGFQFLQLLQASVDLVEEKANGLEMDAAIPFWYTSSNIPLKIKYKEVRKSLSHHILDLVDSVTIMAYRDNAKDQIKMSKADIEYAASIGKKAYVGMETKPPGGNVPDVITYYHKRTSYMNEQAEVIRRGFKDHPGFAGIAVHAYDSFKEMLQNDKEYYQSLQDKFNTLKAAGIMKGYSDGSAGFGKKTSRAEVAAIAARILGYSDNTLYKPAKASFTDVPPASWSYGWIETAHKVGVMNGKGNRTFDPNSNITVEEALIVMAKAIGLPEADGAVIQGASDWAQGWIQAAIKKGLIDSRKNYTTEATREELIEFVYETYRLRK